MRYFFTCLLIVGVNVLLSAQVRNLSALKIEDIMKGEDFVGTSPGSPQWSLDSRTIYFNWNPENEVLPSRYKYDLGTGVVSKLAAEEELSIPSGYGEYSRDRKRYLFTRDGDIYVTQIETGATLQVTNTLERESSAQWNYDASQVIFRKGLNLFSWGVVDGTTKQLTDIQEGTERGEKKDSEQAAWLKKDQMEMFEVLRNDDEASEARKARAEARRPDRPMTIRIGKKRISSLTVTPNLKFVTYTLRTSAKATGTKVPHFVTEDGYLDIRNARSKVGSPLDTYELFVYNIERDTVIEVSTATLPGILGKAEFLNEYADGDDFNANYEKPKQVVISSPRYSDDSKAVVTFRSTDNKDRWIVLVDLETGKLNVIDHQHDEAWIGGPGISGWGASQGIQGWLADNRTYYFMSEESGYSHLYTVDTRNGKKKALTSGKFEVHTAMLSNDRQNFYLVTSEVDPGERHFYKFPVKGGKMVKLTTLQGNHNPTLSPDERHVAVRYSYSNRPMELGVMENMPDAELKLFTDSRTDQFKDYDWRVPELVYFKAQDGANVRARLYRPELESKNGAAIIFVHGAGYLQNVHKWWSSYYREYMFHNLLADNGYTVLDIDYRGSAGYGRDWRTGIYRHMGGKDLSDQVDGAKYLVSEHGIDASRLGIYGGSYGGFITLMAMFNSAGTFNSGAALRSVTDWAHYNHGYTANILNTPVEDSLAYRRSSPIYHAEGLEGNLLMLHGMVDSNVQFQDVVRLSQRLIELGKDNWELAVFPVESHGFTTASSWTDEYKRIYRLFQENLNSE